MKRIIALIAMLLIAANICGCTAEPIHTISYNGGKVIDLPFNDATLDCICVFTQFTNGGQETVVPADEVTVKAFQNGIELSPWVFTGQKTEGYIQCDTCVQAGVTADVVWIFERTDDSPITVEFSDGQTFIIT